MVPLPSLRLVVLAALLAALLAAPPARAQPADPAWQSAWDFLVQSVCTDARDRVLPGITPLDPCAHPRKPRIGEPLPYHKRDWPGVSDQAAHPTGYQQSDSLPVQTVHGPAVLQTYDFGDDGRAFGRMDPGDGGQLLFLTPSSIAVGVTEDGGAGLQLFLGAGCQPLDSWVIVDRGFTLRPQGETVARLTRRADRCAVRLNQAFTRWRIAPVRFRTSLRGQPGAVVWPALVSDHYDAGSPGEARAMERMYFTQALGYTRWEAWRNLAGRDDRAAAARLAASGRCAPLLDAPGLEAAALEAQGWGMVDCREWTQLVGPAAPGGDPPFTWLDRLRTAAPTAALFGPTRGVIE